MAEELYLFLNSNAKGFSQNTGSTFSTVFNTPVELAKHVENFEVGITTLIVSAHALNVVDGEFEFYSTSLGHMVSTRIPEGQYQIPDGFVTEFTKAVQPDTTSYLLQYDAAICKYKIQTTNDMCTISFSENLQKLLGFSKPITGKGITFANQSWNACGGYEHMYVFCNHVELSYVGNEKLPILGVFPYNGTTGTQGKLIYEPVNRVYVPLLRREFQSIHIDIKNSIGQMFSFPTGEESSLLLHIRPANSHI